MMIKETTKSPLVSTSGYISVPESLKTPSGHHLLWIELELFISNRKK